MLSKELEFFAMNLPSWLESNNGRVALVKDQKLVGFFDTESDALSEGARLFGLSSFLVRRVSESQPEATVPALTLGILRGNTHHSA